MIIMKPTITNINSSIVTRPFTLFLLNYTIYQLYDIYRRYELKAGYDMYVQAKMAGAKDLKEVED